jgi:hypothetical protein
MGNTTQMFWLIWLHPYDPIILIIFGIFWYHTAKYFFWKFWFRRFSRRGFLCRAASSDHQLPGGLTSQSGCHRFNPLPSPISAGLEIHRGDCFKQSYTPMFSTVNHSISNSKPEKQHTQFPPGSFFHAFYGTKAKAKGRESICTGHVDTPFQLSSTSAQCDHCCLGPETLLQTGFPY